MKIPFTTQDFFDVILQYNHLFFPAQVIIILLGFAALFLVLSKHNRAAKLIASFLGILWLWAGIAYHFAFFTSINPAAWGFGSLFVLQALFFFYEGLIRKRIAFEFEKNARSYLALFFILYGILIYPLIQMITHSGWQEIISLGLPCPTTILTFGFLLFSEKTAKKYLLIIPSNWTLIGLGAAINFGVWQDFMMLIAALSANIWILSRKKNKAEA